MGFEDLDELGRIGHERSCVAAEGNRASERRGPRGRRPSMPPKPAPALGMRAGGRRVRQRLRRAVWWSAVDRRGHQAESGDRDCR